jgi:hypothetical protein
VRYERPPALGTDKLVRFPLVFCRQTDWADPALQYRTYDRVAPPADAIIDFIDYNAYVNDTTVPVKGPLNLLFNPQSPLHRAVLFVHPLRILLWGVDQYLLRLNGTHTVI